MTEDGYAQRNCPEGIVRNTALPERGTVPPELRCLLRKVWTAPGIRFGAGASPLGQENPAVERNINHNYKIIRNQIYDKRSLDKI